MAGNCQSSECVETQFSSARQEVGLDGDAVLPDYVSKLKLGSHTDSLAKCDDIEDNSQATPFDTNDVEDNATTSSGQSSVEKGAYCSVRVTTGCDRADSEVLEGTQAEVGLSDEHGYLRNLKMC